MQNYEIFVSQQICKKRCFDKKIIKKRNESKKQNEQIKKNAG